VRKTSVYLDERQAARLARLAREEGRSQAAILRDAVESYWPKPSRDRNFALAVGFPRIVDDSRLLRADENEPSGRPSVGRSPLPALLARALLVLVLLALGGCAGSDEEDARTESDTGTSTVTENGFDASAGSADRPSAADAPRRDTASRGTGTADRSSAADAPRGGPASRGTGTADLEGGPVPEGPDRDPGLYGDRREAAKGGESLERVYQGFGEAVAAGIGDVQVPVRKTLGNAERDESLTEICALMSDEARRQTVDYARISAGLAGVQWSCEKAVALLLRRTRQGGGLKRSLKAEVVSVNAEGDRATATVSFGDGPLTSVPLVKEGGEWKLAATPAAG
jgi:hypothetical protein